MSSVEVKVPDVGVEGDVEVIEICVAIGDTIDVDSSIVVLESDKATVEVPSPVAGMINKIDVQLGAKVKQGDLLLSVAESGDVKDKSVTTTQDRPVEKEVVPQELPELDTVDSFADIDVRVPDLGGSDQVEVIEISATVGADISEEETLVVLESDKATMEIPSSVAGELLKLNVSVGDKVTEGDIIASVRTARVETAADLKKDQDIVEQPDVNDATAEASAAIQANVKDQASESEGKLPDKNAVVSGEKILVHAGPAVRKFARELGVDLTRVKSSGRKNRILKEDLQVYIKSLVTEVQDKPSGSAMGVRTVKLPDFASFGPISWQAMDKIQRLTAENMQTSWLTVPHVTQFDEADITNMEAFRKQQKSRAEERGLKLTPVAFLLKACAYALRELPQFNVSLDMANYQIVQKDYVHIGLAVDTPNGLVVPVIRDVDKKNLWQLAEECQSLAVKAKERKLTPAQMQGGCFTISSLGALGGTAFTPIVNVPEVAILGVSKAQYKPFFDGQDFIPKLMLPLSLSYDHRAVNGADAARFTSFLSRVLGDLRELLL